MARLKYLDQNNQWQSLSSIRGPAGPQGPQGIQGPPSIVNLNGYEVSNPSFYAATASGTLNQILVSQGEGQAPEWQTPQSDIEVINNLNTSTASDTKALGAYEGYVLNQNKVDKAQTIAGVDMQNNITVSELVDAIKNQMLNLTYPVGSIYISMNSTNPGTLFGGTWQQIKSRFLVGTGLIDANNNTYAGNISAGAYNFGNNSSGEMSGEAWHTLGTTEIPSHNHNVMTGILHTDGEAYTGEALNCGLTLTNARMRYYNRCDTTGGGQAHNNLPPYLTVFMWKRTA